MSLELFSLEGKRAVVTGASRGIGQALAVGLAEAGAELALVARSQEGLRQTQTIITKGEGSAVTFTCDVSKPDEVRHTFAAIAETWPTVDVLVNNAGMNIRTRALETTDEWEKIIPANLGSAFHCSREAARLMVAGKRGGRIIGIASVAGVSAVDTGTPYAASKAGMCGMARSLALEWGQYGITVSCIAPWYFRTPLTVPVLNDPKTLRRVLSRMPLGRIGEMKDLIGTAIYLASEAGGYVTGQTIVVDGGMTTFGYSPFTEEAFYA